MRLALACACLTVCAGCVPLVQYQNLEKNMSAVLAERNAMTKDLAVCEERMRSLKEVLKTKPKTPVTIDKIDRAELEEIKKKALEETEMKYRFRMNKQKLKP